MPVQTEAEPEVPALTTDNIRADPVGMIAMHVLPDMIGHWPQNEVDAFLDDFSDLPGAVNQAVGRVLRQEPPEDYYDEDTIERLADYFGQNLIDDLADAFGDDAPYYFARMDFRHDRIARSLPVAMMNELGPLEHLSYHGAFVALWLLAMG
jgi:hypothetical protein